MKMPLIVYLPKQLQLQPFWYHYSLRDLGLTSDPDPDHPKLRDKSCTKLQMWYVQSSSNIIGNTEKARSKAQNYIKYEIEAAPNYSDFPTLTCYCAFKQIKEPTAD